MKHVLFIETPADHRASLRPLPEHTLIVNLNPTHRWDYSGRAAGYKTENDYLRDGLLAGINESAMSLAAHWFEDPELRPLQEVDGVHLGLVMENFLMRDIISAFKYLRLIPEILKRESCASAMAVDFPPARTLRKGLTPSPEDKIANAVLDVIKTRMDITVQTLPFAAGPSSAEQPAFSRMLRACAETLADFGRKAANSLQSVRALGLQTAPSILASGAPRLIFPLLEELRGAYGRVVYFQNRCGPRMISPLAARGARYVVGKDHALPDDDKAQEAWSRELRQRAHALIGHDRWKQLFTFEGHAAYKVLEPVFRQAFEEYFPGLMVEIGRYKRLLKAQNVRGVVVDEAVKEFHRPLVLAARTMGIPSVELQHGVPCRYKFHRLATNRMAVWGEYFKQRFVKDAGLSAESIAVTGSPSLDAIARRDKQADKARVRARFGIPKDKHVVTFAATPFHLGSRGGVLGEHLTRGQVERALAEIVRAMPADIAHMMVKLHPSDPCKREVYDILRGSYRGAFHVLQAFDVHALINGSDTLISLGSTTMLEAIVMDTPVLYLNFLDCPEINPYVDWNALWEIRDPAELADALRLTLKDRQAYKRRTEEGRQRVLKEFANGVDGRSARRCAELLRYLPNK